MNRRTCSKLMPWRSQSLNPLLPLLLDIVGSVCGSMITAEATTEPQQCQCQRHQEEPTVSLSQQGLRPLCDLSLILPAQGCYLPDSVADVIGHPYPGLVQLLPRPWEILAPFPSAVPQVLPLTFGHSFCTFIFQICCSEVSENL